MAVFFGGGGLESPLNEPCKKENLGLSHIKTPCTGPSQGSKEGADESYEPSEPKGLGSPKLSLLVPNRPYWVALAPLP